VNLALSPTHLTVHRTPLARLASDHFPLVCELMLKPIKIKKNTQQARKSATA
jgi:hypothetical protein